MPDLGAYAGHVLAAWGAALLILGAVVGQSLRASAAARRALDEQETRRRG